MTIIIKEVIVRTTVEKELQWSEHIEELISDIKDQVLIELEEKIEIDNRKNESER